MANNINLLPNHFDKNAIYVEGQRSNFPFKKPHLASFMAGMLVPLGDPIPVYPGQKFNLQIDAAIRSNTLVVPPLDSMFIDFYCVWVPHRIVWNHMPQFLGENDLTAWTQSNDYVYPSVTFDDVNGGILDVVQSAQDPSTTAANLFLNVHYGLFYGLSISSRPSSLYVINQLAHRGYYFIWNYLFRDENYQRPVLFSKGDRGDDGEFGYLLKDYSISADGNFTNILEALTDVEGEDVKLGSGISFNRAVLMPLNKLHDWATSGLPQPQFGDAVPLNQGIAPIYVQTPTGMTNGDKYALGFVAESAAKINLSDMTNQTTELIDIENQQLNDKKGVIYADLAASTATTINQFRTAVMYQRYLEALARGGRRVPEYYEAIYHVTDTAAKKDYPLLLTRSRYVLGVNQVVATADGSGDGWTSHLGDTGAFSYTVLRGIPCCEQTFTEFGYLHVLYGVRSPNRYSQAVAPHFLRQSLLDEYNPYFDHIGDVGVKNGIVNVLAKSAHNFFYQEAWWDVRTQQSLAVGAVNKLYGSLKYWTIGEVFDENLVTCTPEYLVFDPAVYNDVFVSPYYAYPQFIGEFVIRGNMAGRMSAHSIPGIVGRI